HHSPNFFEHPYLTQRQPRYIPVTLFSDLCNHQHAKVRKNRSGRTPTSPISCWSMIVLYFLTPENPQIDRHHIWHVDTYRTNPLHRKNTENEVCAFHRLSDTNSFPPIQDDREWA